MKKIVGAIIAVTFIGLFWFKPWKENNKSDDTLVIGMMSGWAPFMSVNPQGKYEGFDVDIALELCARLRKNCQINDIGSLASLFIALETNKIDAVLSGLDITKARREKLSMVPYFGEGLMEYSLVFWQKIPDNVSTIADLKNLPRPIIVVEPGVGPEKYLDQFEFLEKKQIASLSDRLIDLQFGKSTAVYLEPKMAKMLMSKNPQLKALNVPLPREFQIDGMGIALKKADKTLSDTIALAIDDMKRDGTIDKLASRWFVEDENVN